MNIPISDETWDAVIACPVVNSRLV